MKPIKNRTLQEQQEIGKRFKEEKAALLEELRTRPGPFDGHTHSNVSDGRETLAGLCYMAKNAGIAHLAVTDHEFPLNEMKARELSLRFGIDVIPGVELTAAHTVNGKTVLTHLGILWLPGDDEELNRILRHTQSLPMEKYIKAMLLKLYEHGLDPSGQGVERSYEMILERNPFCSYLGKGVVAQLLVDTGLVSSRREANDRYLGRQGERLAYAAKEELFDYVDMERVLKTVNRLNRARDTAILVTLNHPYYYCLEEQEMETLVRDFSRLGGHALEVVYPKHGPERVQTLRGWCEKYGLLENVGSDYHYDAHSIAKGDPDTFETLRKFHRKELTPSGKEWW